MDDLLDRNRRNIVVIGTSAGGVEALLALFAGLPPDSFASYFVVLHIPAHSPSQLDRILQRATSMHVSFAHDQQLIMPNSVYLAAPDRHMMLEGDRIRITRGPRECRARPAIDVLFRSAALAFGPRVIGVVLTGSLDDGTAGLWQVKDRKGLAFVQDPAEAPHRSMPDSALEHVDVDVVGPIKQLSAAIALESSRDIDLPVVEAPGPAQQIENQVALEGDGMYAAIMELGKVSKYTCPECHGVLVQIEEGKVVRFRCHTGHAYSFRSLLAGVNDAIDTSLWSTVRAIEERILVLRQLADIAEGDGKIDKAVELRNKAEQADEKCQPLRELVLDANFFTMD